MPKIRFKSQAFLKSSMAKKRTDWYSVFLLILTIIILTAVVLWMILLSTK